tara:strand:+ start:297 stop:947 length:651 start_codon:yes stop_codon:yes gene_type:complete
VSEEQFSQLLNVLNDASWLNVFSKLGPLAILLSVAFAYAAIKVQKRLVRRRATLDVLFRLESDEVFLKAAAAFRDVKKSRGLEALSAAPEKKSNRDIEEEYLVDTYINHIELLCVGMAEDTIDEVFVFQYMRKSIVSNWNSAQKYIKNERENGSLRMAEKLELFATHWYWRESDNEYDIFPVKRSPVFVTKKNWLRKNMSALKYLENNAASNNTQH